MGHLGGLLSRLETFLGRLEALLGSLGGLLGRSWGFLGASWGPLGGLLGASWALLRASKSDSKIMFETRRPPEQKNVKNTAFFNDFGPPWAVLGAFWADLGGL